MKILETTKLHYKKYLYKFEIRNELATIFRTEFQKNGKLQYARGRLDECKSAVSVQGYVTIPHKFSVNPKKILLDHLLDAEKIYSILLNAKDYTIRCDSYNNSLCIYSNDLKLIVDLDKKTKEPKKYLWKPKTENTEFLLKNADTIIVNQKPSFDYKVTFNHKKVNGMELHKWIKNNSNKVKVTERFLKTLLDPNPYNSYLKNLCMYVNNEYTLTLLHILVGNSIGRVDKLIYMNNIDK